MLAWSIPRGWRIDNPCEHVKTFPAGEPWAAWSWEAIEAWREHAVPELVQAMSLALYTGQRRSDLLPMTWADVDRGVIRVKGRHSRKAGKDGGSRLDPRTSGPSDRPQFDGTSINPNTDR